MTLLQQATEQLTAAEVPTPRVDAELLLAEVLGMNRGELQSAALRGSEVHVDQLQQFEQYVARRSQREPVQHILKAAAFRTLNLAVGPGVFVPRPETELLVEHALTRLREQNRDQSPTVLDIGTGSGAIALSIASEMPSSRVFAVEKSPDAHRWAAQNFLSLNLPNATLVFGDIADPQHGSDLAALLEELQGQLTLLVSNPPYIPAAAIPRDPEVRLYDPELALYSGADGLDLIRVLSALGQRLLRPGGELMLEHGEAQASAIAEILAVDGWINIFCEKDLTSRDRYTLSTKLS